MKKGTASKKMKKCVVCDRMFEVYRRKQGGGRGRVKRRFDAKTCSHKCSVEHYHSQERTKPQTFEGEGVGESGKNLNRKPEIFGADKSSPDIKLKCKICGKEFKVYREHHGGTGMNRKTRRMHRSKTCSKKCAREHWDNVRKGYTKKWRERKKMKCKICGKEEKTEEDIEIYHRGCRLGQFFQRDRKAEREMGIKGSGLMILNITKGKGKKGKELVKALNKITKKSKKKCQANV